jgi:hypothetical protein
MFWPVVRGSGERSSRVTSKPARDRPHADAGPAMLVPVTSTVGRVVDIGSPSSWTFTSL